MAAAGSKPDGIAGGLSLGPGSRRHGDRNEGVTDRVPDRGTDGHVPDRRGQDLLGGAKAPRAGFDTRAARAAPTSSPVGSTAKSTEEQKPMECDVAVLGGGPGGATARDPRRAARRQGRLHREGARARRHLPPRRLHSHEGLGADRLRDQGGRRDLRQARSPRRRAAARLRDREPVEGRRRQADDRWRRAALQGERRRVGQGRRPLHGREHDRGRGWGDVTFRTAIVATGSFPMRPPIEGLDCPAASTRPGSSPNKSFRGASSSSAAGSSAASSRRSSPGSAPRSRSSRCSRASSRKRTRTPPRSSRSSSASATSHSTSRSSAPRSRTRARR